MLLKTYYLKNKEGTKKEEKFRNKWHFVENKTQII